MKPWNLRLALAVAVIPTVAFILHDLVFQLPDNEGEASLGLFIIIASLLCVWAGSGYIVARPINSVGSRTFAGAVAGILSVGILWLTFIVLNYLFLDRMSYEPDRLRAFQQSGYSTMREYWNHQHGWGPFPLALFVAAIAGAIGGALSRTTQHRTA